MSHRTRRTAKQACSMTGSPKRPWRTVLKVVRDADGYEVERSYVDEPVSYNASPGPAQKPKLKRHPVTSAARDLLSALHAVRLGIPLSDRGRAILFMHLRGQFPLI